MKTKTLCNTLFALTFGVVSAQAAVVGGIDPATATTTGLLTDTAADFMVISNQFSYTTTAAEDISLSLSTFSFQSNDDVVTAGAIPFLAIQTGAANSHIVGDYDVIWVGTSALLEGTLGTDVSAPLGVGTFTLPAGSTIVGGFFGSGAGDPVATEFNESPVSAIFATGDSTDVLVIAQVSSVSVAGDLALSGTGTNWSTTAAVTTREYHYQIDLQPVPEPSAAVLFGIAGFAVMLRRRRR